VLDERGHVWPWAAIEVDNLYVHVLL